MLPPTSHRVTDRTAADINLRNREDTRQRVERIAREGHPAIDRRLRALDQEWDVERTLEANASTLALTGSVLALTVDRRFALVPLVVGGFLLQHALQGWCPPLPVIRRMGVRTTGEIDEERMALKALRGDFREASGSTVKEAVTDAVVAARSDRAVTA